MTQTIDDRAMLNLARTWAPYGHVPAGEIWVTFGMGPDRFYTHLTRIVGSLAARELSPGERRSLRHLAERHVRAPYAQAGDA